MKKKKNFKIISIIMTFFVISTLISLKSFIVKATEVYDKPMFDIEFKPIPESALAGEEITIEGEIIPQKLKVDIKNVDTEIIFVIDKNTTKKGMGEVINSLRTSLGAAIRGLSLTGNIKLGLIDYSTDANIFKDNNNAMINITDRNKIATKVESIRADESGYSNTGEALRKAAHLMESSEGSVNKNRIILLFSDGPPTARTVDSNGEEYIDITKEGYGNAQIKTSKNDYTKDIEYAKTIGNKIKENGCIVYTIGYNIANDYEESVLREIHQSMTGDTLDNRFYILPAKKVTEEVNNIFESVKKDVSNTYPVNNVNMNINFTGDFSLNIGGNTIDLNNINYQFEGIENGKAVYKADKIPFSFIIKGDTEGYQQIFDKVTITYPWNDTIEKVDINKELFITIKSNELPSILAKLESDEIVILPKEENSFTVRYRLYPEDFQFNDSNNSLEKDVIIVVDNSKYMDQNAINGTINSIMGDFVDNSTLKNTNTQYSIITLAQTNKVSLELTSDRSVIQPITSKIQSNSTQWNSEAYLGSAFSEIHKICQKGRAEASKNIIIVAQENVNYTEEELNDFKQKVRENGYNVIVLIAGQQSWDNNLNKMSYLVGQNGLNLEQNNLFKSGSDPNSIANGIMRQIRDRLINSTVYKPYIFNPQITVGLLDNFEAISGLEMVNDNTAKVISNQQIIYNHIGNNNYHAEPIEIVFDVGVKENKYGQLNFGTAVLTHKSLNGNDKKIALKTPIVIVEEEEIKVLDLTHGLYNGIDNEQGLIIQENIDNEEFEIVQGSIVTIGANFNFDGSSIEFDLNIDNRFKNKNSDSMNIENIKIEDIKIYKVLKDSSQKVTLEKLDDNNKSIVADGDNKFKISINNMTDINTEILIVYQGKVLEAIDKDNDLKNTIKFGNDSRDVLIVTPKQSVESPILPDLF